MNDNEYENLTRLCLVETQMTTEIKRITDERAVVRQQILDNPAVATRAEGSMHVKHENFKVTTTGKLHRRISFSEYEEIKEQIPEKLSPFVVVSKLELDLKRLRALELANPELHKHCCRAIEETPGLTGVKIESLN
tara:strand:+ start:311 stop:718 length:408 start_codon:yes stop_codon:yes gene_type:complete